MTWERGMLVALAVIFLGSVVPPACRCVREATPPPDGGSTAPPGPGSTGPDAPPGPVVDAAEALQDASEPAWTVVSDLPQVEGLWGSKDQEEGWAELISKTKAEERGETWRYPYPWHLLLHPPETPWTYDCGVHERLEDAGAMSWRIAWCEGGDLPPGRRHAKRLVLSRREAAVEFLKLELDGSPAVELDRN